MEENVKVTEEKNEKEIKKEKHGKKGLEEEILKLQESLGAEKEKALRIQAEMMNFRRRKEEEVANYKKYANEDILKKMLGIIDNFERALSMETEENKEFLNGFRMIYNSILNILNENEVVEIDCLSKEFNPEFHQAVLTEHVDGFEEGYVVDILQKGYMYKDRVLRPAMVKVSE